jgi:hypothetical protein
VGREIECKVTMAGQPGHCKVHLDSEAVQIRGEHRATLFFANLRRVEAKSGTLHLDDTILELGPEADKWSHKILNPPTLLDKLGLKPGMSIALLGFSDRAFMRDEPFDTCLVEGRAYDAVLLHAEDVSQLRALQQIKWAIGPKTMLWIVYPKGRKEIMQNHVFAHGKGIGLVDVKVCKFSDRLTALKFLHRKS